MAAISPMEGVDIAVKIGKVVKLFKDRKSGLHDFEAFLEEWQVLFQRLQAEGCGDGAVAAELLHRVAADLQLCEERINDGSWLNKVHLKRVIDEKETAEATRKRMASDLQRLHTELLLAVQKRSARQYEDLMAAQAQDAAQREVQLKRLKRTLRDMQEDGEEGTADVKVHIAAVQTKLSVVQSNQQDTLEQMNAGFGQVLQQGRQQFEALSAQNKESLAAVQRGFQENRELHAEVMKKVQASEGNVIGAIEQLGHSGDQKQDELVSMLQRVLLAVEEDGERVTEQTVENATGMV